MLWVASVPLHGSPGSSLAGLGKNTRKELYIAGPGIDDACGSRACEGNPQGGSADTQMPGPGFQKEHTSDATQDILILYQSARMRIPTASTASFLSMQTLQGAVMAQILIVPALHMGAPDRASGSWLQTGPAPNLSIKSANKRSRSLFLFASPSLCLSNK